MRQFLASINVVFFSRRLVQLFTESRVDIGFNPLKLFSDASINSSLVESSTASASTHNTNQVSLKWNVIFLTLTKLNKFRVQILGPFSQEFYKKKLSKSDFTHFLLVWLFVAKCTYYFSIVPRVNWTSRVSFATVFSTWKKTYWRDISVLVYNWHVEMENLKESKVSTVFWGIVPLPTELPGTAARFFYHWGRQLKSQQNECSCGSTERSEVLLDVLSVMLTLRLAPKAVDNSGCKAGL